MDPTDGEGRSSGVGVDREDLPVLGGSSNGPEDDPRVSAALEDYLDRLRSGEPPDRAAFLNEHADLAAILGPCLDGLELVQAAAPDLPLREAVEQMPEVELPAAARLGDYQILRQVGRGGMGVVYEAEQVSLGRRVALKVLPLAAALDPRQLQRFRIEAQAAALLHHPHIVPIFAVGTDRGLHYYAMQFINGPTLAEVVRELAEGRKARETLGSLQTTLSAVPGGSGLSSQGRDFARAVARLGQQAAEAIEHAHSLGVLHRDLKPSNLMLDAQGDLWITDFGLARVAANPDLTRTGDLLGTVRYMSPEQAAGNRPVDVRSDIYALGVTLYELMTLRPAFGGSDRHAVLRSIAHDEPTAPRRIDPSLPRDLETIVLKAMAKEPTARYATAAELAADLERFLADQSIHARRPGLIERAARWGRRHRPVVATAVTVLLATLTIAAALLWRERQRTQQALDALRITRGRERETMEVTLKAMDQFVHPFMGMAASKGVLTGPEGRRIYRDAITLYERIGELLETDPAMKPFAAIAYGRVGFYQMILKQPGGDEAYRKAIALFESIADGPEGLANRAGLLSVLDEYYTWLAMAGRKDEAEALAQRLVESAERLGDELPEDNDARARLVHPLNDLAWRILTNPNFPIRDPHRAVKLARRATSILPVTPGKGEMWNTMGLALYRVGDDAGAAEALQKAMEFNAHVGTPDDWLILAMVRHRQGRAEEARDLVEQAHAAMRAAPASGGPDRWLLDREACEALGIEPLPPPTAPKPPAPPG